jgi:hypothetical protein
MADFFTELKNGLTAAQDVYGENFTLDSSLTVFKGVVEYEQPLLPDEIGAFDDEDDASILASKTQFATAGVTPTTGNTVTYNSDTYRVLRINEDNTSYELVLRKILT